MWSVRVSSSAPGSRSSEVRAISAQLRLSRSEGT
jgi:hypothetical protein